MDSFANLLKAIAALLWPVLVFTLIFVFKTELRQLLARLRRGKVLGQEIELDESLDRLELSATAAEARVPEPQDSTARLISPAVEHHFGVASQVLEEATRSPKAALLLLSAAIENELRSLVASIGLMKGRRNISFQQALEDLNSWSALPIYVTNSVKLFRDIRNRLVHGHEASPDDILRAIDSGIVILKALQAIPHEINVVYHPGVPIYADEHATAPIADVRGVILETVSPGGATKSYRIFPTTRDHFQKGMRVSWEWSGDRVFGAAWYRDPDSGELKQAWRSSMEFVGRNLEEL